MLLEQPAKRLSQVARRCLERAHDLERYLFRRYINVVEAKLHLKHDSPERGYYTAGYLQALSDVRYLISEGEFPAAKLAEDGGPRVPSRLTTPSPGE
jgi:hypothetical protein